MSEFTNAGDCLEIDEGADTVDLRSLATYRIDNLRQFEVCLQRIFSYLDGPEEVRQWLVDIGFEAVYDARPEKLYFWNFVDQTEGFVINASWRDSARRGTDYPLSRSFGLGAFLAYNLSIQIKIDSNGEVFDLDAGLSFL